MTRKRVVRHPGAAWVAAVGGAWLVAVACRTCCRARCRSAPPASPRLSSPRPWRSRSPRSGSACRPPSSGCRSSSTPASSSTAAPRARPRCAVRSLPRATFHPAAPGRVRLVETGDELELATVSPVVATELLLADATPYRGLLEVRPAEKGRLTVVNVVNLEDYVRGVVPNELSPQAFPQIEALKAQAVAARTYALSHVGDYASKGVRRLRDGLLPGLPRAVLGAPAERPRGRGDEGHRGDVARTADPRLLHVHLRGAHRGGRGDLRRRRLLPPGRGVPAGALVAARGCRRDGGRAGSRPGRAWPAWATGS